ncbi:MAG TPA: DUF2158 domain-containing protein [Phycisphaerae bacterium]|nr:DUF2158 domain-containing protein [Phycisphaerae bacterium]
MTDTKHDDGGPAIRTGDLVRLKSGGPKMTNEAGFINEF